VTKILITGMSGTGKSATIVELASRDYRAIDTDDDTWLEWHRPIPHRIVDARPAITHRRRSARMGIDRRSIMP
jgi:dephospho-CoA kinase